MGDDAWRSQPKLMSPIVIDKVATALGKQYYFQQKPFSVVLHGGEPLLLGAKRLSALFARFREELPNSCGLHIQTNGILLTDEIIDTLVQFSVGVSVSIDGPELIHDQFRKDHKMKGSYLRVRAGIERLVERDDSQPLFAGVLCVINLESDPGEVYATLKETQAPSLDFLVRDGNWDQLPFGKSSPDSTEYGEWLSLLLEIYLSDSSPPRVRILDDMLRLILGGNSQKEGVGTSDYGIIVIEPDGRISKNDTLKVAFPTADQFDHTWFIGQGNLSEFLESQAFEIYYKQQRPVSKTCTNCSDLSICGGGMVAHRWSSKQGFNNPTIFCSDQRYLIANMKREIAQFKNHETV